MKSSGACAIIMLPFLSADKFKRKVWSETCCKGQPANTDNPGKAGRLPCSRQFTRAVFWAKSGSAERGGDGDGIEMIMRLLLLLPRQRGSPVFICGPNRTQECQASWRRTASPRWTIGLIRGPPAAYGPHKPKYVHVQIQEAI